MNAEYKKLLKAIEREKKTLIERANKNGLWENFGQKELHKLDDKFNYPKYYIHTERDMAIALMNFEQWAINYTL
jgi:hypothetical protein